MNSFNLLFNSPSLMCSEISSITPDPEVIHTLGLSTSSFTSMVASPPHTSHATCFLYCTSSSYRSSTRSMWPYAAAL